MWSSFHSAAARRALLPALFASPALMPLVASAQSGVPELVITARQRPENPEKLPVSVDLLSEREIERLRVDSIRDVAARVPGLTVNNPFGRFNPAPAIRGLTQPGVGDETSVGFFLDGVYISGRSSIDFLLTDLERVEVLKGPQNALFGRNTFGGAVNLVTRKPSDDVEGFVEGTLGSEGRKELAGAVNVPLVPGRLAARASALVKDYAGFYDNALPGGPRIGSERTVGGSFSLRATLSESLEALLRVSYAEDRDGQPKGYYVATNCEPRLLANGAVGAFSQYCGQIPERTGPFAANPENWGFRRDAWRTALTVKAELDFATLTTISAFNAETNEFNRDDDYSAALVSRAGQLTDRWDVNQELRLTSAGTGPFGWLVGANFYRFDNETERRNQQYAQGQTSTAGGARTAGVTDSYSVFGGASYRIRPDLTASAELRWQRDLKVFRSTARDRAGRPIDLDDGWTLWTPRVALSWQATERVLAYASVAKGAKSGGFNEMANLFDNERSFGPEENWTYEIGAKTRWLDGRLTANGALFWIDWSNQQVVAASAAGLLNNFYTNNAGESRSRGVELELAAVPTKGFDLRLAYTYVDAVFVRYNDPDYLNIPSFAPTGRIDGKTLPRHSPHSLAASGEWRLPEVGRVSPFVGAELTWQSRQVTENSNLSWIAAQEQVSLWAGGDLGGATLTLRVRNLFDDRTPPVATRFSDPSRAFARAWIVTPGDGRTVSATVKVRY